MTQSELKECLSYDERTGVFVWIKPYRNKTHLIGRVAGFVDAEGYVVIKIKGRCYRAHNLAWMYVHGCFPKVILDHKDGQTGNNAILNLREVDYAQNSWNQRKAHADSSLGYLGVARNHKRPSFRARIQINGKRIPLGCFQTAEAAYQAYVNAKRAFHSTCEI